MRETRLDKAWREKGLDSYSLEAILGTLRHYGVSVSEESLRQVGSEEEALELAEGWQRVWKGTGPFRDLPSEAALELWDRLGQHGGDARHGLGDAFFTRFHAVPLEQKLTLAREAAGLPGFHGCDVLNIGHPLRQELKEQGRLLELGGVLEAWEARQPRALDEAPEALAWRVELALRQPGADVARTLLRLSRAPGECAVPLLSMVEWSLYRGHLLEVAQALEEVWLRSPGPTPLSGVAKGHFLLRTMLVARDMTGLVGGEGAQAAFLEQVGRLLRDEGLKRLPELQVLGLLPWSPAGLWEGTAEQFVRLREEELKEQQSKLVGAFEQTLWGREGWLPGRTQLLHPRLALLVARQTQERLTRGEQRPARLLLPDERVLARWAEALGEGRVRQHGSAATALALRPWGEFLLQRGLVNEEELAEWLGRLRPALAPLVNWLEQKAEDPELAGEVRRAIER
jgi:hypothetical protein